MKPKTIIISLLIVLFALCSMGQSGCGINDLLGTKPKAPPPVGEFQSEWWLKLTTTALFGEMSTEEREDGVYIVAPPGFLPDGDTKLTFTDGTVLTGLTISRWEQGGLIDRIVEVDPETGAPLKTITTGFFSWEMYSDAGELLFIGTGLVQERSKTWQDGQTIEIKEIQPLLLRGTGFGVYKGYSLTTDIMGGMESPRMAGPCHFQRTRRVKSLVFDESRN